MRRLLIPLAAALVTGCASRESSVGLNAYQTVPATEPKAPVAMAMADYRINPLDELRVDVFGEPELSIEKLKVGANGKIILPMAGEIVAEGLTTSGLSQRIATALLRYLREPKVAINVVEYTSQKVTVEGAVKVPGVFQAMHQMTLMDTIAMGQGLNDYSKSDEVLVFRRQDGKRYVARFDLGAIQMGAAADPAILPGDVVVVGYSASRRLFSDIISLLPATVGIFFAIIN